MHKSRNWCWEEGKNLKAEKRYTALKAQAENKQSKTAGKVAL